jgi:hypothetical protein
MKNNKKTTTKQKPAPVGFCAILLFRVDFYFYQRKITNPQLKEKNKRAICDDGMTRDEDENSNRIISNSFLFLLTTSHTHPLPWIQL